MTCRDCAREDMRVVGRGLCGGCYDRHWQAKTLDQFPRLSREPKPIPSEKPCPICKVMLPLEDFAKNNRRPDGRGSYCKPCAKAKYHRPARERKRAVLRPTEGEQGCRTCGDVKPFGDFYWEPDKGRHRYDCKVCMGIKGKEYWNRAGVVNQRERQLKAKFGLSEDAYLDMLDRQAGACAICKRTAESLNQRLAVDHCHASGRVRALLCSGCNCALGLLGEDLSRLTAAAEYLKVHALTE